MPDRDTRYCAHCGEPVKKRTRFVNAFCGPDHYHAWRRDHSTFDHAERQRDYSQFKRGLWGGSGKGQNEAGLWAKVFGRRFEEIAIETILPSEGFTEIDDLSGFSNQFFIDIIATLDGERVLVDVTSKWKAYVPEKRRLAEALRMRLFILHISPADPAVYHLAELRDISVARVPMAFFHRLAAQHG